ARGNAVAGFQTKQLGACSGRGRERVDGCLAVAGRLVGSRRESIEPSASAPPLAQPVEDLVLFVLEDALQTAHEVGRHRLEVLVAPLEQEGVAARRSFGFGWRFRWTRPTGNGGGDGRLVHRQRRTQLRLR